MKTARPLLICLTLTVASLSAWADENENRLSKRAQSLVKRQFDASMHALNRPFKPFCVIGNLYYVGASDVSSFLVATPDGLILIDSGFDSTVPMIRESVRALGFRYEDIRLLLNTHAHLDHAGGHALIKRETGARIVMSAADAELLARGGKGDFLPLGDDFISYPPATADQLVRDGDHVSLGSTTLIAHLTPGHTRGCTTWTLTVADGGQPRHVVIFGSTTLVPGVRLVGNSKYPGMAQDFAATFRLLKSLPCDVFLAPHGSMYDLDAKARRLSDGASANPFIDPEGYRAYVERSEKVFLEQLRRESE